MKHTRLLILAVSIAALFLAAACAGTTIQAPSAAPPAATSAPAATTAPAAATAPAATSAPAATTAPAAATAPAGAAGVPVDLTLFVFAAPCHKDIPLDVSETYTAEHSNVNVEIVEGSNAQTMPQAIAAFKTTPDQPLYDFGYYNQTAHSQGEIEGMWESLDMDNIPNAQNILPQFRQPDDKGIAFATGYFGIVYNTDKITEPPTSYADLFKPEYKGHVAIWDYTWYPLLAINKMNGGDENNVDAGFKMWADNADQLHSLVTSNQQLKDLMVSGDVWIAIFDIQQVRVWNEQEGAPVAGVIPKEGAIAWPLYLNVVKGVTPEQKKEAEMLINEFIAPETLRRYAEATYYAPTATGVELPEALKAVPSMSPDVLANAMVFDWATVARNTADWTERWDREVKAKMQ